MFFFYYTLSYSKIILKMADNWYYFTGSHRAVSCFSRGGLNKTDDRVGWVGGWGSGWDGRASERGETDQRMFPRTRRTHTHTPAGTGRAEKRFFGHQPSPFTPLRWHLPTPFPPRSLSDGGAPRALIPLQVSSRRKTKFPPPPPNKLSNILFTFLSYGTIIFWKFYFFYSTIVNGIILLSLIFEPIRSNNDGTIAKRGGEGGGEGGGVKRRSGGSGAVKLYQDISIYILLCAAHDIYLSLHISFPPYTPLWKIFLSIYPSLYA